MAILANTVLALLMAAGRLGGETKDAEGVSHSGTDPELRVATIAPVAAGALRCRPTFCCCGVCYGAAQPVEGLKLEVRVAGGTWRTVEDFPYFEETKDYRGSIMGLREDTAYEVRVDGKTSAFRTWRSDVKVARTVVIDPRKARYPVRISDRGAADGWVRYTVKKGDELKTGTADPILVVEGARNVIIEGVPLAGTKGRNLITVERSENVRIVNCRFSHWGRDSVICYEGLGRPYETGNPPTEIVRNVHGGFTSKGGRPVNFDGAVEVRQGCVGTVIERCWFHDCNINANSWYYSHPAGGEGVVMSRPEHSTVIRWCDFTGSDLHRWNDAVESNGNFSENGGFNRDADVYGNFIVFAADDCIELDGGQQNVRCFDNRFESALCGVSIQGCMASPVYVRRNGFYGMCDMFGLAGQTIKTGGGPHGEEARAYIAENLLWGRGSGITMMDLLRAKLENNVFCDRQRISGSERSPHSSSTGDRFGVEMAEERLPSALPVRPLGFRLDRARFGGIRLEKGKVTPAALTVTATSTSDEDIPFETVWNDDMPWLRVEPRTGVVKAGGEQRFTVTFDTAQMNDRHDYRGAFLVRTPEGLSRAVTLYVETDFVPPLKADRPGDVAVYLDAEPGGRPVTIRRDDPTVHAYTFTVPKDGRYHFMFHQKGVGRGKKRSMAALDDEPFEPFDHETWTYPVWAPVAPGNKFGNTLRFWSFRQGETHVLKIRGGQSEIVFDKVVMTDNPGSFEPR